MTKIQVQQRFGLFLYFHQLVLSIIATKLSKTHCLNKLFKQTTDIKNKIIKNIIL